MSFYGSFVSPLAAPIVIIDFRPASNSFAGKLFRMVCAALLWIGIRPCTAACLRLRVRVCARLADFEQKKNLQGSLCDWFTGRQLSCPVIRSQRNPWRPFVLPHPIRSPDQSRAAGSMLSIYAIRERKASGVVKDRLIAEIPGVPCGRGRGVSCAGPSRDDRETGESYIRSGRVPLWLRCRFFHCISRRTKSSCD